MKTRVCLLFAVFLFCCAAAFLTGIASAGDRDECLDQDQCAKMLRFGKEAYTRGRYLDAKEFFRRAIAADPGSTEAWLFYDQAVIFALAERVEQEASLLLPGVSERPAEAAAPPGGPAVAPPAPKLQLPSAPEPGQFRIVDDEGC